MVKRNSKSASPSQRKSPRKRSSTKKVAKVDSRGDRSTSGKRRNYAQLAIGSKLFLVSRNLLREIRRLQASVKFLIPKLPFARLVREVLEEVSRGAGMKLQSIALEALQETAETFIVQFFEDSYLCSGHAKRITLQVVDMALCARLQRKD